MRFGRIARKKDTNPAAEILSRWIAYNAVLY
jgi:hypothetical protein